jgi:hypothetical protein
VSGQTGVRRTTSTVTSSAKAVVPVNAPTAATRASMKAAAVYEPAVEHRAADRGGGEFGEPVQELHAVPAERVGAVTLEIERGAHPTGEVAQQLVAPLRRQRLPIR